MGVRFPPKPGRFGKEQRQLAEVGSKGQTISVDVGKSRSLSAFSHGKGNDFSALGSGCPPCSLKGVAPNFARCWSAFSHRAVKQQLGKALCVWQPYFHNNPPVTAGFT